jgi:hypothetical protein
LLTRLGSNPHVSEQAHQASFSPYTGSKPDLI